MPQLNVIISEFREMKKPRHVGKLVWELHSALEPRKAWLIGFQ
jgi:hypothetical protein